MKFLNINYLQECITCEFNIKKTNLCIIAALYKFHNEFTNIITTSLELTLQAIASKNPFLSLVLGDFNAKNKVFFDQDNTTTERTVIDEQYNEQFYSK